MADDLDKLLDEVESKFCRNVSLTPQAPPDVCTDPTSMKQITGGKIKRSNPKHSSQKKSDSEDIDALLDDIFDEEDYEDLDLKVEQLSRAPKTERSLPQSGETKCCPVFLGGSSIAKGVGTAVSQRSCDQLRCTSCDFRVVTFDDHEWDASSDYLFFRNNMPDCQKLRARLRSRGGRRAYACQCSWFSAGDPTPLREQPQLKWVCGKHSI